MKTVTPKDLDETYGLTEGDLNHGQLMLDQFLFMRPRPGWSNHKTPIDHLYLCGSGVHGGGGQRGKWQECGEVFEVGNKKEQDHSCSFYLRSFPCPAVMCE
jgi:hypothetical protein